MPSNSSPWFALLTPEGPAGVAVWMLGGKGAWDLLSPFFKRGPGFTHGLVGLPDNQSLGRLECGSSASDEILLVRAGMPPDDDSTFEIHSHGGDHLAEMHRRIFRSVGFHELKPTSSEVSTGKTRLVEHLESLAQEAMTARGVRALLRQAKVLPALLGELASLCKQRESGRILSILAQLELGKREALHWVRPFKVSVLGPPNVGKSSLLNCLAGTNRAVVSPIPGTTVDPVRIFLAIDGWPVELCDTAGLRETSDELEQKGISLAIRQAEKSDLVLWLQDGSADGDWVFKAPQGMEDRKVLLVLTKMDLTKNMPTQGAGPLLAISSMTGQGIDGLQQAILRNLIGDPALAGLVAPVACSVPLAEMVEEVGQLVKRGSFQDAADKINYWLEVAG